MVAKLLFLIIVAIVTSCNAYCASDASTIQHDVEKFVFRILSDKKAPKLSDYDEFYGSSELEPSIVLKACEKKGWNDSIYDPECHRCINDPRCQKYIKSRNINRNQKTSLFLEWLRTKLPLSPKKVSVEKVECFKFPESGGIFDFELVSASLDDTNVTFFYPAKHPSSPDLGIIHISKINGIPVSELLEKELSSIGSDKKNPLSKIIRKELLVIQNLMENQVSEP